MPDDENLWIADVLRAEADAYELDVDALLARLSQEEGRPFVRAAAGLAAPDPDDAVVVPLTRTTRAPAGRDRGRTASGAGPRLASSRARGWLQPAFAVAAACAVVVAVAVAAPGRAPGDGARVEPGGTSTPAPTRSTGSPATLAPASSTSAPQTPPLPPATSDSSSPGPAGPTSATGRGLPDALSWKASGPLVSARQDTRAATTGLKDPSVVLHDGHWHVFATAVDPTGLGLVHLRFSDWSQAGTATPDHLDVSALGAGYRAAPQVFWFAPQKRWYLVMQTDQGAAWSTNPDIDDPTGWSAPQTFYRGVPRTVRDNLGSGSWVDMWVVCDSTTCHLFSTDTKGRLYRSQTRLADFPQGMSEPVVALQEPTGNGLLDGAAVYRVQGSGYLLLTEAIDQAGHRYTRAWQAPGPAGPWTPRADPFASAARTTFGGTPWTQDVSQGELVRAGEDQTMTIPRCGLRYLVGGKPPGTDGTAAPWRLGLLVQTPTGC